ncbi:LacI family DNA-binding transcriptional regulator [Humisphaera borealis]|uniref:LacI family DNA-binding transcriptional regulator n=1 Tax=Humisphaera borealis TaxID=2807512 RepID=A0A7M2X134_9BACT|nr:LacI family DNA-binding transcriptional regulator [Humisphaera borealis]
MSIPTVHQVLNGYNVRFSAETRKKVLEAAKELDYRPNIAARGLRARKSFLLGLQFNAVNYPLIAGFTRGFQQMCTAQSYAPIFLTHVSTEDEAENCRTLIDRRVDGLIVNCAVGTTGASNAGRFAEMRQAGTHLVEVFGRFVDGAPRVTLDYRAGAVASTELLIAKGHKKIALFTHSDYRTSERIPGLYWTAWEHWRGYEETMRQAGLEPTTIAYQVSGDRTREGAHYFSAYENAKLLLNHPAKPTAAVFYRGEAVEAILHYASANPSAAPEGFGISVFDRVAPTHSDAISLYALPQPIEDVGQAAAKLLLDSIAGREVESIAMGPKKP